MDQATFPWRPLGELLVEKGVVKAADIEVALAEQRSTGRLLGEILVNFGYVTSWTLAQVLAEQHGVELERKEGTEDSPAAKHEPAELTPRTGEAREWQPLGKILVANGFLSQAELDKALAAQAEHPDRRLGEILVARGALTGTDLALALADQHGLDLGPKTTLEAEVETIATGAAPAALVYRVLEVAYEPSYRRGSVLYETANFLEAADYACELAGRRTWDALEIEKADGGKTETVWTYSESRAAAEEASRERLVHTFGYDPTRWDTRRRFDGN
jgi:chitinase